MGATKLSLACATQPPLEDQFQKRRLAKTQLKKRVVPARKLRHLARSVSTVAESKGSVEETVRMALQSWKD